MNGKIELTTFLKLLISGAGIAVCGLIAFLAGDLVDNTAVKHAGTTVFCFGVAMASFTVIFGTHK